MVPLLVFRVLLQLYSVCCNYEYSVVPVFKAGVEPAARPSLPQRSLVLLAASAQSSRAGVNSVVWGMSNRGFTPGNLTMAQTMGAVVRRGNNIE